MREELKKVFELLNAIQVAGYSNVKRLSLAMDMVSALEAKLGSGELVVRTRSEGTSPTDPDEKE